MGLINHYYWFEAAEEDPDQPSRLHFFEDGDLGSMLLVTAASILDTSEHAEEAQELVALPPRRGGADLLRHRDPRVSARRRRGAGRGAVPPRRDRVGPRRLRRPRHPRAHPRADRRERAARAMTTVAVDRLAPVTEAPPDPPSVAGQPRATGPARGLVIVGGRRRRRLRRPARLPRRSQAVGVDDVGSDPQRPRHARAAAVDDHARRRRVGIDRGRRHRPGLAHDPERPAVPPSLGDRRPAAARLPELHRRRRPARRVRARRPRRRVRPVDRRRLAADRSRASGGAWFVLTLFTYPYVYLPVAARLGALSPSLEESARLLGRGPARHRPLGRPPADRRRRVGRDAPRLPLHGVRLRRRRPAPLPHAVGRDLRVPRLRPGPCPRPRRAARRRSPSPSSPASGPPTAAYAGDGGCAVEAPAPGPARAVAVAGLRRRRLPRRQRAARPARRARLLGRPGPHRDRPHRRRRPRRPRRADHDDGVAVDRRRRRRHRRRAPRRLPHDRATAAGPAASSTPPS